MGGLGYFPTYTLGNLYAAQFMEQARHDLGDLDDDFRRGEFGRLKDWLNEQDSPPGHALAATRPVRAGDRETAQLQAAHDLPAAEVRRVVRDLTVK